MRRLRTTSVVALSMLCIVGAGCASTTPETKADAQACKEVQYSNSIRIRSLVLLVLASSLVLVGCGTHSGLGSASKVAAPTTQPALSTSTSALPASAFNPQGASTPSQGAVAFENAIDNQNAVALCNLITPAYVVAVAKATNASSSEPCVELWTNSWKTEGPSPIPPQEENPTVVSAQQTGDTAQVVIDYNIPPNSGATLANDNVTLTLQNGRWLVSTAGD